MREQLHYGKWKYISFVILDIVFLIISSQCASWLYLKRLNVETNYTSYYFILIVMIVIDLLITWVQNTLNYVLRRRKRLEVLAGINHIGSSFVVLAVFLFTARQGIKYSRVTILLTYAIYFVLFVGGHIIWRRLLNQKYKKRNKNTAILMTTDRFVDNGINDLQDVNGVKVKYIYLLKNLNRQEANGIPVLKNENEEIAAICWDFIDKVYIYGIDHQMISDRLIKDCWEMGIEIQTVGFEYKIIELKTIANEDPKYGELSFLEGERDIPFPIRRAYWITETEAELHRGFHAHKLNCQLLFCPYGEIDILLDDGKDHKTTVTLNGPEKGLILMPGMWREMIWKKTGSVLCVLASEYYDPKEYIRDYDEFLAYRNKAKK